ncbi:MAG: selenide, water dikinase SelD [Yoonia sp.]|nr:selenide, water dikinase SelD [Yoonia sp.]
MNNTQLPLTRDLVLIGGGHTHALVLRKWGMNPLAGVRLTVINPGPTAPYSGMLPGFVAGHYTRDELDIDLVKICRFAGARLILGAADGVDRVAKTVSVAGRPPIAFDVLSVDVGITSAMPALSGFADHGTPAKPLGPFASKWDHYRTTAEVPKVAVIGGGVAGAELALAMRHSLGARATVHLIDRGAVLKDLGATARAKMRAALDSHDVQIVEQADVTGVDRVGVRLADGRHIAAGFVTGAAGAKPHDWQANIGVAMHEGFITINSTLQSSDPAIFAVGDCAHMAANPRPKAGVFAVRQAPVLAHNLRAVLAGGDLQSYAPQGDYLKLISLGKKSALAEKFGTAVSGPLLWQWKDRIDRKFMDKFVDLPQMAGPALPRDVALGLLDTLGDKPMCGGCGAKVGRGVLREVLADLPATNRDDVQSIAGDDAAILRTGGQTQIMTTDHLRSLTADPVIMTRIAAVHALGDAWAMGAAPQAATATIILPRMSSEMLRRTLAEIMQTAHTVMGDAGAAIVGGHSSLGDELTIGFAITGLCDADPITISGAKPGDVLILTKPIGSGVLMAAEMAGQARGADVASALSLMTTGQAKAAQILHGAHAMTDVTGFGLVGHLSGICEASGVDAIIDLDAVPWMDGALDLAIAGVRSSLFKDNQSGAGPVFGADGPKGDLLFDPQTAGGLLAAIDGGQANGVLWSLQAAGYPAAIIGQIQAGDGAVTVQTKPA